MSLLSNDLLETIKESSDKPAPNVRLAEITRSDGTGNYVKFYGDDSASKKSYKKLASYSPEIGDTVLMINVNGSFLIAGKVE